MKFVFDLDGTICFKGQPFSGRILKALKTTEEKGHEIFFASARPIRDMIPVVNKHFHNHFLIGGNGSLISREGKTIYVQSFSNEQMQIIRELIGKYQATYLIDSHWDYAYTGAADHPILNNLDPLKIAKRLPVESLANIVKVLVLSATDIEMLAEKLTLLGVVVHKYRDENSLDISPENINKWIALQKIGVEEKQFVAFGNDANDISMFQKALYSVRIGDHKGLGEYATESISLDENCEKKIIKKLEGLSLQFLDQV